MVAWFAGELRISIFAWNLLSAISSKCMVFCEIVIVEVFGKPIRFNFEFNL